MSSSTPRPTMPSSATSIELRRAPTLVTSVAGAPLYIRPSTKTWQRASMWLTLLPWKATPTKSPAHCGPFSLAATSPAWIMWCSAGLGLSTAGAVARRRPHRTVTPSRTRAAALVTRSGVRRLSAPRSSSSPQRPHRLVASNSSALTTSSARSRRERTRLLADYVVRKGLRVDSSGVWNWGVRAWSRVWDTTRRCRWCGQPAAGGGAGRGVRGVLRGGGGPAGPERHADPGVAPRRRRTSSTTCSSRSSRGGTAASPIPGPTCSGRWSTGAETLQRRATIARRGPPPAASRGRPRRSTPRCTTPWPRLPFKHRTAVVLRFYLGPRRGRDRRPPGLPDRLGRSLDPPRASTASRPSSTFRPEEAS